VTRIVFILWMMNGIIEEIVPIRCLFVGFLPQRNLLCCSFAGVVSRYYEDGSGILDLGVTSRTVIVSSKVLGVIVSHWITNYYWPTARPITCSTRTIVSAASTCPTLSRTQAVGDYNNQFMMIEQLNTGGTYF